jgi:HSP20 family molecular chaperone IbpA
MATTRVVTRLLAPKNLHRLSSGPQVRYFWHHHHHRRNVPDINISPVSNFFERWEKEFDRMRQKFNDFVLTESDGSKKFHLSVNVHGFEPEEIKIKTQNGLITISAKKEKKVK